MRRPIVAVLVSLAACAPSLPDDAARADFPRVLAVRSDPPEAAPGETVQLQALVTDGADPVWSLCVARKALAESGPVARECLAYPDERIPLGRGGRASADIPRDACRVFGPDPPLAGGGRAVDPDATGGYYQPGLAGDAAFSVRVRCGLAGATQAQTADFEARYRPNTNPEISEIRINDAVASDVVEARLGDRLRVDVRWPETAAEAFVAFDPESRAIVERQETLSVALLASTGTFAGSEWVVTASATLYVVLRDTRGGVAFRAIRVNAS